MKIMLMCSRYGPPWNEGSKNIVRVLEKRLPGFGVEVVVCSERNDSHNGPTSGKSYLSFFASKPFFWWSAAKKARDEGVEIIHLISSISSLLGIKCFFIRLFSGIPLLVHLTGLEKPIYGYKFLLRAERIIVGGTYLKRFFPNSVNLPPVSPHVNAQDEKKPPQMAICNYPGKILYLGAMEAIRGVHTLVDALEILRTRFDFGNFTATLAWNGYGDFCYKENIKAKIKRLGIKQYVRWLESVEDIPTLYREHDIVVIPRASRERMAFPLRLIEAMSYGKPVVVSDMGDMARVADGCGLIFPHEDADALSVALLRLLSDRDFYAQCTENCYHKLSEYHSIGTVRCLADLYKEAVLAS